MQSFIGIWILILFGMFFGYYLDGSHFWFPCHNLVPSFRELSMYVEGGVIVENKGILCVRACARVCTPVTLNAVSSVVDTLMWAICPVTPPAPLAHPSRDPGKVDLWGLVAGRCLGQPQIARIASSCLNQQQKNPHIKKGSGLKQCKTSLPTRSQFHQSENPIILIQHSEKVYLRLAILFCTGYQMSGALTNCEVDRTGVTE